MNGAVATGCPADKKEVIITAEQDHVTKITEDNPDAFWDLIHQAKTACGQDIKAMEHFLMDRLISMGPESAMVFHKCVYIYSRLADQYGLWDAAGIVKERGCSDEGFMDFRPWLIAQGKETYMAVLKDPDTLADVEIYGDCSFSGLSYAAYSAYEQLTGQSIYQDVEAIKNTKELYKSLKREIVYKDGIQFPREMKDLPNFLPRLCEKYGGADRSQIHPYVWNLEMSDVNALLIEGKTFDKQQRTKKTKSRKKGGNPR